MVGVALFVGWCVGFVYYHAQADRLVDANNIVLGRDFMAFYLAGSIVNDGHGERVYEPALQQTTQDAILGAEKLRGLSYYINPRLWRLSTACSPGCHISWHFMDTRCSCWAVRC